MDSLFSLEEVAQRLEIEVKDIERCIDLEWISPADFSNRQLDSEDVARLSLICDLVKKFEVNEEAVPLILHLIDQINSLRSELEQFLGRPRKISFH